MVLFMESKSLLTDTQREQLVALQTLDLTLNAQKILTATGRSDRQVSYQRALVALFNSFEDAFVHAVALRFELHEGLRKKLYFKKDRIRLLRRYGIDYQAIDGYATASALALIVQSIRHEQAQVTPELDQLFAFWKTGYPMVQLDNAYRILSQDIQIHYQQLIHTLLEINAL